MRNPVCAAATIALCVWAALASSTAAGAPPAGMDFWRTPRRGGNLFDSLESGARLRAAAAAGIEWVRLAPDKWAGTGRDFLLGNADSFVAVPAADFARLRAVLDSADAAGLKVALVMLSLPGARWRQHNGGRSDFRLYRDEGALAQAADFWRQVAGALRGHPALVAYDLLNEPHPDRARGLDTGRLAIVQRRIVAAIRAADPDIPVLLEGAGFASPAGIDAMAPLEDPHALYSFHFYEPWAYIDHRQGGRWRYPGPLPAEDDTSGRESWGPERIEAALAPVLAWQARHGIPPDRVVCAEFGVPRTHPGADAWLRDVIRACERHRWHWAFYSFREDTWPAMDYELGPGPLPPGYWQAVEGGRVVELPRRANPLWDVVSRGLAGDTTATEPATAPGKASR
jgi:Cellulase (glycosyl hydrolase family 5)